MCSAWQTVFDKLFLALHSRQKSQWRPLKKHLACLELSLVGLINSLYVDNCGRSGGRVWRIDSPSLLLGRLGIVHSSVGLCPVSGLLNDFCNDKWLIWFLGQLCQQLSQGEVLNGFLIGFITIKPLCKVHHGKILDMCRSLIHHNTYNAMT